MSLFKMKMHMFVLALAVLISVNAYSESISIPLKGIKKPANDLIYNGQVIDSSIAAQLAEDGFDLSSLNPEANKIWLGQSIEDSLKNSLQDLQTATETYPQHTVQFLAQEAVNNFTYMAKVQSAEGDSTLYRLALSRYSHSAMMRSLLLKKLGFNVSTPRYYKKLKIIFSSEEEKKDFVKNAEDATITDFSSERKWIIEDNKAENSLTMSHVVLENMTSEAFDWQWGFAPNPHYPKQAAVLQLLSKSRAFRSLIVPFLLVDIPESINRYAPKAAAVFSENLVLNYFTADSFASTTLEDIKWLQNRLAHLQTEDLKQIVAFSGLHSDLHEIVLAKLIYRINSLFELSGQKHLITIANPSLNINSASGLVKDGKVTQEIIAGYPLRYAHGDRTSPYNEGDLGRYIRIEAGSTVVKTALDKLNDKMKILSFDDALAKRRSQIQNRITNHIKNHPDQPLYQEVEAWGGPLFGFDVGASRHIATGTYYESSAPVQLVDNVRVGMTMGYFLAVDGIAKVTPNMGTQLSVVRDYTHVRPINSIKVGTEVSWGDLNVPSFMRNISDILESNEMIQDGEAQIHPLDKFVNDLQDGEVFTITESVTLAAYFQLTSTVDVLMGLNPVSFINTITLGADTSKVILRQTSISKNQQGLQIYVRKMNTKAFGFYFDLNYFINLISWRSQRTVSDILTDAFIIDYNPKNFIETDEVEKVNKLREDLRLSLKGLFKGNDADLLYGKFKHKKFVVDHKLETKEIKRKILFFHKSSFKEAHWVNVLYPEHPDHPELKPEDEKISLFTYKEGILRGKDVMSFFMDIVDGFLSDSGLGLAKPTVDNPANMPHGKASWRVINAEVDISPKRHQLESMASLQRVWGGWRIKKDKFIDLIDELEEETKGLTQYRLIEKEMFHNVKSVDFYRVTVNVSFLSDGINKIKEMLTMPNADKKERDILVFSQIMKMLGQGDMDGGHKKYVKDCIRRANLGPQTGSRDHRKHRGQEYACIEEWTKDLIDLGYNYPEDKVGQAKWIVKALSILDNEVSLNEVLKYLGPEHYIFFTRVNGFRVGDEDGDLEYFSNTVGDLEKNQDLANGLVNYYARKTRISPVELDRSQGGFN